MKPVKIFSAALALLTAGLFAADYSLTWSTIDGGGGTSTNGPYTLTGTVGQPDTGASSGGPYLLQGGFWVFVAVQTPGSPTLAIQPAGPGQARLAWSPDTPGFILQFSLTLTPPAWTNAPTGATNPVVVPATLPTRFYRVVKP
jgi:hypothetical protein